MGAVSTVLATVAFASGAAALSPPKGEGQPASPGVCTFAVAPLAPDGSLQPGSVTVSVTALPTIDESLTVQLFLNGAVTQSRAVSPPPALPVTFTPINVITGDSIAVNYILRGVSTYSTVCATVEGQTAIRVGGIQAARLAFTGSSNTSTMVLVAVAAMVLGLVLVVGTRRRRHVNA
ncbi:MAG: LPXTG cell wall anchor domain-containing protein [Acidimicrobiia bacterium]